MQDLVEEKERAASLSQFTPDVAPETLAPG